MRLSWFNGSTITLAKSTINHCALLAAFVFGSQIANAQLPELALPSTATGVATTAKFFAGSTADDGATYASNFAADQAIDVATEIQPESAHVGSTGNLYLIIVLGEQFFMRVGEEYLLWDGELGTLQAVTNKSLDASEPITIVENVAFGTFGLANSVMSIFIAYDTEAAPGELYFSGVPLGLTIEGDTPVATSFDFFVENISSSIVQGNCIVCHSSTGPAASTPLIYARSSEPNFQQTNHNALINYITSSSTAQSEILSKPQGVDHSGGTRLQAGSAALQSWTEYIALVISEAAL